MVEVEAKTDEKVSKHGLSISHSFQKFGRERGRESLPPTLKNLTSQFNQHIYVCLEVMVYRLFHKITDTSVTDVCNESHVCRIIIASN